MLWRTLNPWFYKCSVSTAPTELKSQPTNTNFLHQPVDHILVPICSHSPFVHGTLKDTSAGYMDFSEFILDKLSQILTLLLLFFSSDILPPHIIIYRRERLPYQKYTISVGVLVAVHPDGSRSRNATEITSHNKYQAIYLLGGGA